MGRDGNVWCGVVTIVVRVTMCVRCPFVSLREHEMVAQAGEFRVRIVCYVLVLQQILSCRRPGGFVSISQAGWLCGSTRIDWIS